MKWNERNEQNELKSLNELNTPSKWNWQMEEIRETELIT